MEQINQQIEINEQWLDAITRLLDARHVCPSSELLSPESRALLWSGVRLDLAGSVEAGMEAGGVATAASVDDSSFLLLVE